MDFPIGEEGRRPNREKPTPSKTRARARRKQRGLGGLDSGPFIGFPHKWVSKSIGPLINNWGPFGPNGVPLQGLILMPNLQCFLWPAVVPIRHFESQ